MEPSLGPKPFRSHESMPHLSRPARISTSVSAWWCRGVCADTESFQIETRIRPKIGGRALEASLKRGKRLEQWRPTSESSSRRQPGLTNGDRLQAEQPEQVAELWHPSRRALTRKAPRPTVNAAMLLCGGCGCSMLPSEKRGYPVPLPPVRAVDGLGGLMSEQRGGEIVKYAGQLIPLHQRGRAPGHCRQSWHPASIVRVWECDSHTSTHRCDGESSTFAARIGMLSASEPSAA